MDETFPDEPAEPEIQIAESDDELMDDAIETLKRHFPGSEIVEEEGHISVKPSCEASSSS